MLLLKVQDFSDVAAHRQCRVLLMLHAHAGLMLLLTVQDFADVAYFLTVRDVACIRRSYALTVSACFANVACICRT